jgi:hypothetical protein
VTLLGDVFVSGDPTAAWQRLVLGEHDTAIARLDVMFLTLAPGHPVENVLHIAVHVAGEQSSLFAILDQALECAAWFNNLGRQLVHLEVARIEQDDAALRVKHVQSLRHVVERCREAAILLIQTAIENADHGENCKTCARNERGLTRKSRWQDGGEHAGPSKIWAQYCAVAIAI